MVVALLLEPLSAVCQVAVASWVHAQEARARESLSCRQDMPNPGRFHYVPALDRWTWDETVFDLHRLPPALLTPSTEALLESVHPHDRDRVVSFLDLPASDTDGPAYVAYRVASEGDPRRLVAVGRSTGSSPVELAGFFVDVTVALRDVRDHAAQAAIDAFAAREARIQQAVGQVMLVYAVGPDEALGLMREWSSDRGVPLDQLADRLVDTARRGDFSDPELRSSFDGMLHDATCAD